MEPKDTNSRYIIYTDTGVVDLEKNVLDLLQQIKDMDLTYQEALFVLEAAQRDLHRAVMRSPAKF